MLKLFLILLTCASALATSTATATPTKFLRIGLGTPILLAPPFDDQSNSTGASVSAVYERAITDRFSIGIDLAYRRFGGAIVLSQLGYGLLLKHGFETGWGFRPFLEYGLLLQVTRRENVEGSGTSHDTKLGLGVEGSVMTLPLFVDASYHFSRLRYFETASTQLDYFDFRVGARIGW